MSRLFDAILLLGMLLTMQVTAMAQTEQSEVVAAVPAYFPPYYFLDEQGQPAGHAIETLSRLAEIAQLRVRYLVKPDWGSVQEALRQGEADLIPNLGITQERLADFDFTAPLETFSLGLFVRSDNTDIHSMKELEGKTVALVKNNAAVTWIADFPGVDGRQFEFQEQALFALLSGEVDALIYPINVSWKMAAEIGVDQRIRQAGLPLLEIKRAVAVRKGNQALFERLDQAVREFTGSEQFGQSYSRLYERPEMFWTLERVLRYGSGIAIFLLVLAVFAIFWWHQHSMVRIRQTLLVSVAALELCRQEKSELEEQLAQGKQQTAQSDATVHPSPDQ